MPTMTTDKPTIKFLKQVRSLLEFHQAIGISSYPLTPDIKQFLRGPTEVCETPKTIALAKPAKSPSTSLPASPQHKTIQTPASSPRANTETLDAIHQEIAACKRCQLHEERNHVMLGEGTPNSGLMIIGEWPGLEDDLQNTPFGGAAGELLAKMLGAIHLKSADVFITLAVKCRTPGNRSPNPEEIRTCLPILHRQIKAVAPKIICTMGPLASQALLHTKDQLIRLRGHFHNFEGIPVMPTFHPGFLVKNPEMKKATWLDLQMIERKLAALNK